MTESASNIITAKSARKTAGLFNLGNILAMAPGLFVVPFSFWGEPERMTQIFMLIVMIVPSILWFAASIVIYIFARHHPNERAGHYTQQAAYRYYGVIGVIVVAGTFYGTNVHYWTLTWAVCALVLIPWSLLDLMKIYRKEPWQDMILQDNDSEETE